MKISKLYFTTNAYNKSLRNTYSRPFNFYTNSLDPNLFGRGIMKSSKKRLEIGYVPESQFWLIHPVFNSTKLATRINQIGEYKNCTYDLVMKPLKPVNSFKE